MCSRTYKICITNKKKISFEMILFVYCHIVKDERICLNYTKKIGIEFFIKNTEFFWCQQQTAIFSLGKTEQLHVSEKKRIPYILRIKWNFMCAWKVCILFFICLCQFSLKLLFKKHWVLNRISWNSLNKK